MKRASVFVALLISLLALVAPIHAQTQAEMNATARAEFVQADAELSQRAWLAFRDAEAEFEGRGGTMAPTLRYATKTELTQRRIKQLKTRLTGNDER
jgi:uncharacterized protein YecT (DUF1311 family)